MVIETANQLTQAKRGSLILKFCNAYQKWRQQNQPELQSKPGIKVVYPTPCKDVQGFLSHLFAGTVPDLRENLGLLLADYLRVIPTRN